MIRIATLVLALVVCGQNSAEAANDTINTATQSALGEKKVQTLLNSGVAYFGYQLNANRSYAAVCWVPSLENRGAFANWCTVQFKDFNDGNIGTTYNCCLTPELSPKAGIFVSLPSPVGGLTFLRAQNISGATNTMNVVVVETTLAAPWYFVSTASGYDAFVEYPQQHH